MIRETLTVAQRDGSTYPVVFGSLDYLAGSLEEAGFSPGRAVLVTDLHVAGEHGDHLEALLAWAGYHVHVESLPAGESTKSARQLDAIYDSLLEWGIDRRTAVFALGGGVVGDLAGFAAATLLRGLPLVQVPTTLVAQVDSSIGGKTGINHALGKNLIGAFYPPRLVYVDPSLLGTLPTREWTSGLAEVVKHACILNAAFFAWLEDHWALIARREPATVDAMIRQAAAIKIGVVSEDEHEHHTRMLLNFGHTFGHAIERVAGYGTYTHGEAVAMGMKAAVHLSHLYQPELPVDRLMGLLDRLTVPQPGLPVRMPDLLDALRHDKKTLEGDVRFVLLRNVGEAYVQGGISPEHIADAFRAGLGPRVAG